MSKEITCEITKKIAVLGENEKGYTKELNLVSWNGATPKVDVSGIRNTSVVVKELLFRRVKAEN